jgi:hypothetical protein
MSLEHTVKGRYINAYPAKEKGKYYIQLLCKEYMLDNPDIFYCVLRNYSVDDLKIYEPYKDKHIKVSLTEFANKDGKIVRYIKKGAEVEVC